LEGGHELFFSSEARQQCEIDVNRLSWLTPSKECHPADETILPLMFVAGRLELDCGPAHLSHEAGLS
jgi:hypothetical protein